MRNAICLVSIILCILGPLEALGDVSQTEHGLPLGGGCETQSNTRFALVIGNSYEGGLEVSGERDARVMAEHLCQMSFSVFWEPNANYATMIEALMSFRRETSSAPKVKDIVFFYSGHGFQLEGKNYLLPNGSTDIDPEKLEKTQIPLRLVFRALKGAPRANKIILIDACRNSIEFPVEGEGSLGQIPGWRQGMARPAKPPARSLVSYSTGYGEVAFSGEKDELSPYSSALLDSIREPGLSLSDLLERVRDRLGKDPGRPQTPKTLDPRGLSQKFYFKDPIPLPLEVNKAQNDLVVIFNGDVALTASVEDSDASSEESEGKSRKAVKELALKGGSNKLALLVASHGRFQSNQNWRRPDAWKYEVKVDWPGGVASAWPDNPDIFDCREKSPQDCLKDGENIPAKNGPRFGNVFEVLSGQVFVDPKTWELRVDLDPDVWKEGQGFSDGSQEPLWTESVDDLDFSESNTLSNYKSLISAFGSLLEVFSLGGSVKLPDTSEIHAEVYGVDEFAESVGFCMKDRWSDRVVDIERSVGDLLKGENPRPFDSFDEAVSSCVYAHYLGQNPDSQFERSDVRLWSAFDQVKGGPP